MPTRIRTRARNYVAMSPLLLKGGVHERSKSAVRAIAKNQVKTEVLNWREALDEEGLFLTDHSRTGSGEDVQTLICIL